MSLTVTVKLHAEVLPAASAAVQLTVVVPFGNADPDGGLQTTEQAFGWPHWQSSIAVGVVYVTNAEH